MKNRLWQGYQVERRLFSKQDFLMVLLMRLSFKYAAMKFGNGLIYRPMIPLTIRNNERHVPVVGILDSGSDFMLIPRDVAEYLNLELTGDEEAEAVGGKIQTKKSVVNLTVSDGKNNIHLPAFPVGVIIQGGLDEVIIGRIPFFSEFDITFRENSKRVELIRVQRR